MINSLIRQNLNARGISGGSVIIASGSEIRSIQKDIAAKVLLRSWFRLYSDGFLEQGSCVPFTEFQNSTPGTTESASESYTTIDLFVPYDDTSYEIQMTMWDTTVNIYNDTQCQSADKTYKSFSACQGTATGAAGCTHIRENGGVYWRTSGYVSAETMEQILAGREWDPVTESWGGEYLVNIESGSRELTLEPGRYKVYMVGKGGEATGYAGETRGCKSGGSGGTIIATFTLSSTKSANCIIDDTNKCTKLILDNSDIFVCGYGTTSAGGTNTVDASFSEYIDANEAGSIHSSADVYTWDYDWGTIYAFTVKSYLAEVLGVTNGNSGSAHSNHGGGWAADSLPGEALIRLFKYGD